jgi:hypothetical protein
LYLRRKALEEALEKLKRGETIGPSTKAAFEKEQEAKVQEELEKEKPKTNGVSDNTPDIIPDTPSSITTVVPIPTNTLSLHIPPQWNIDDSTSDTHSISDIPATPASTDTTNSRADTRTPDLLKENLRDSHSIRQSASSSIPSAATDDELFRTIISQSPPINDLFLSANAGIATSVTGAMRLNPMDPKAERIEVLRPESPSAKTMDSWEMLKLVIDWVDKEHAADEEALARQLANGEISYRFLWLYYTPGSMISLEDPVSKQQMAARVNLPLFLALHRQMEGSFLNELTNVYVGRDYRIRKCNVGPPGAS